MEQIRKQQTDAREALEELDLKQKVEFHLVFSFLFFHKITLIPILELDEITAKAKNFTVEINSDDEADETGDGETESATVQCVTCRLAVLVLHVSELSSIAIDQW